MLPKSAVFSYIYLEQFGMTRYSILSFLYFAHRRTILTKKRLANTTLHFIISEH